MKTNNKKKKQILSLAMLASIGTSFGIISPDSVSAAQTSPIQNTTQEQRNVSISDWREPLQNTYKAMRLRDPARYLSENATFNLSKVYQSSVEADGSPTITSSNSLFAGRTILNNTTDQDQTLTTNEFSKTFENSVTSSTTNGFNLGVSASSTFKIPLIGETSVEISTEYNFSNTSEKTKTESYTYTASSQNIVVPANSSVEVIVNLNTAKLSGNVKLLSHVDGKISYNSHNWNQTASTSFRGMLTTLARPYEIANNVKVHPSNGAYLIGKGKYSAEYGTEFVVTVRPVVKPNKSSAKLSESTNEGYTYTVKPEVKKVN
ncbi:ETX/MTX2 family pore-forming toxin [Bacillus mycoides]|uniref:ETX/MTX2 family pore-forming toxin n=1 Tax=Bacillus mycoides TaxID=1405 RepID=UPI00273B297E|nr:ETX/MTX2 family pore-forming toxin [Bacillus mycoides]